VVPSAPGDQAGVREGDIIVSLFGTPVTGAAQLAQAASALQVGLPYPVEVIRGEARLTLTVVQEGGADFSRQSGDSWIARQTDPAVITDVTRQLAASAAFAETAMKEAIAGHLEAARDLAERSAKAMTGELDLTGLPPVEAAIEPRSVAAFGAANASLVEETHRALDELMQAQSEMARAQAVASSSPDEADRIRRDAESKREKAVEKFPSFWRQPVSCARTRVRHLPWPSPSPA
jgi:membrane-associated protease RseP (regulator of RpoE activity)